MPQNGSPVWVTCASSLILSTRTTKSGRVSFLPILNAVNSERVDFPFRLSASKLKDNKINFLH